MLNLVIRKGNASLAKVKGAPCINSAAKYLWYKQMTNWLTKVQRLS